MTMMKTLSVLGLLGLASCSMISKKSVDTGGGGGGGGGERKLADNIADAPTFHVGESLSGDAMCKASGYMKIDAAAGEAFKIHLTIDSAADTCFSLSYLTAGGGSSDPSAHMYGDLCTADKGRDQTFEVVGIEGGSLIQMYEEGPCQNAKFTLSLEQ